MSSFIIFKDEYDNVITAIETLNTVVTMDSVKASGQPGHNIAECTANREGFRGKTGNRRGLKSRGRTIAKSEQAKDSITFIALNSKRLEQSSIYFTLDSGATDNLVTSELRDYMSDVQNLEVPVKIGTAKSGQSLLANKKGNLSGIYQETQIKIEALIVEGSLQYNFCVKIVEQNFKVIFDNHRQSEKHARIMSVQ
ncbi:hypothetical protein WA026_017360 [Henosepilachna vigintioctopunctata]|uniref:Uncharacterized protein n=1 Tax=Henosepilachna vigintioctopunctata TaxID=420089 RepID=A0AAW1V957_9CUCU